MPSRLYPEQPESASHANDQLDSAGPALTCNLVAFHPRQGELPYFSWTERAKRGPGIIRTGINPPFMRTEWDPERPWATTDDPESMRVMCNYIDEDGLAVDLQLAAGEAPRGSAPADSEMRDFFARRALHAGVHTLDFHARHPGKSLVGQIGCADTTMNLWHVAFIRGDKSNTFLYLVDEPIFDREYPCLVGWRRGTHRDGNEDVVLSFEERVRFSPVQASNVPPVWVDEKDCSEEVEFAVSGKPLLNKDGQPIPFNQVTHFFRDLRHLFSMPKLTPHPHFGTPVVMFGEPINADLWLGEKQLLDDVNLQRAACKGPVLLDRLYGGLSVTRSYLREALLAAGYTESRGSVAWRPGEFSIDPYGSGFEIYFNAAKYPWNILAVGRYMNPDRKDEPVILSFVFGGKSGRSHFTLQQAVDKLMEQAGKKGIDLRGAVLLDEGGDVFQKVAYADGGDLVATVLDPLTPKTHFACQRRLVRCCFFFAKDNSK